MCVRVLVVAVQVGFIVAAGLVARLASVFSLFDQPMHGLQQVARPVPPHVLQVRALVRQVSSMLAGCDVTGRELFCDCCLPFSCLGHHAHGPVSLLLLVAPVLQCLRLLGGLTAVRCAPDELLPGKVWPHVAPNAAAIVLEMQATSMVGHNTE